MLLYLVLYSLARFLLEYLRIDVTLAGGVNVSQVTSAVAGLGALALLIARHWGELLGRARRTPEQSRRSDTA